MNDADKQSTPQEDEADRIMRKRIRQKGTIGFTLDEFLLELV